MPGIVKVCRRRRGPLAGSPERPEAASPMLVGRGFRAQGRAASPAARDAGASPRPALLAENLGKPSLWVMTKGLWY